ncbi:unnamed protein product [Cylicocyclus nassatus]|uniref:Uncharacterized protein n=1 Tax=Cylicocyclus nassatus TaxID=53992 RepID=A0AA36HGE5_CYLNA|nr:unnamed protein product [Cylicocyclus nassatus]
MKECSIQRIRVSQWSAHIEHYQMELLDASSVNTALLAQIFDSVRMRKLEIPCDDAALLDNIWHPDCEDFCYELLDLAQLNTTVAFVLSEAILKDLQLFSCDWADVLFALAVFAPIPKGKRLLLMQPMR